MANERLYLTCVPCLHDADVPLADCLFVLAKYYPSTGWYTPGPTDDPLNRWFDQHQHGGSRGRYVTLFQGDIDPRMSETQEILSIIQTHLADADKEPHAHERNPATRDPEENRPPAES